MITVNDVFAPNGLLSTHLASYECRTPQVRLASCVEDIIDTGGVLIGEAGTGTGKTMAYLVPALLSGKTVIVSTGTRNLQEQIFFKDLVFLQKALGGEVRTAYLKGQDNYLCQMRHKQFMTSPACLKYPSESVESLNSWAAQTLLGDRMEIADMSDDSPLWREVCSTRDTRIGQRCPYYDACFVTIARREAVIADLIVVNHHLYCADLATRARGGAILPDHDVIIFDEAHLVEDIATEFFSTHVSSARIERTVVDAVKAVSSADFAQDTYTANRKNVAAQLSNVSRNLFDLFRGVPGKDTLDPASIDGSRVDGYHKLDALLEAFATSLQVHEGKDEAVDHAVRRIVAIRNDLAEVLDCDQADRVYWVDTRPRSVVLGSSPIDVSGYFYDTVLMKRDTIVMCSATLSTGGTFDYFKSRLGIDDAQEIILDAPFNYETQSRVYIPNRLPAPRSDTYFQAAIDEIKQLISLCDGGAFLLCTSVKQTNAFHDALSDWWDGPLFKQGDAPKFSLIEQFATNENAVLVATTSFWQGVDIPGRALRLVMIDKLPFAVPTDPVTAARIEDIRQRGLSPFAHYQLPGAALILKQGFGRLIRTARDRGIVAILDSRICTKPYGHVFLDSLPPAPLITEFQDAHRFWKGSA